MPAGGGGGSSTRATSNGRGERVICSIFHGLVEERAFVQMSCSIEMHRRCALGFVEDAISRARINGVRTVTHQVTCPNPALHEVHQEVYLHSLLQQIQGLGGTDRHRGGERAIDARVVAAELRLNRRSITETETIDLPRSVVERGEEDIHGDWRGTAPQLAQVEAPRGACGQQITDRNRFVFEGWLAHTECAVENVQGASDVPPHRHTTKATPTFRRRDRVGCPPKWTVGKIVAVSDSGGGGATDMEVGEGRGRDNMHVLRTGSGRDNSGVRGHSQADTRLVPRRRVYALQLHAGTSGWPRERAHRPEVLRCVQQRVGAGKTTSPPCRAC